MTAQTRQETERAEELERFIRLEICYVGKGRNRDRG